MSGNSLRRHCAQLVLLNVLLAFIFCVNARAQFTLSPSGGWGPIAGRRSVVTPTAGGALFRNPAVLVGQGSAILAVSGGDLLGMPELRRASLAAVVPVHGLRVAAGASAFGDALYRETLLTTAVACRGPRGLAGGIALEAGAVGMAARGPRWAIGSIVGVLLRARSWGVGAALHRLPTISGGATGRSRLDVGVRIDLVSGTQLVFLRDWTWGPLIAAHTAWVISHPVGGRLELIGAGEVGGALGFGVRLRHGRLAIAVSESVHPLLGDTPDAGLEFRW